MNTKIVYVLVSGENDFYLAQAATSAYTARQSNPNAQIVLVVDQHTSNYIKAKGKLVDLFTEIVEVHTPDDLTKVQRSRYLKTTLRHHIKGDYLFIDTDTVIVSDLSEIDHSNAIVAATLDRHALLVNHPMRKYINKDLKKVGLSSDDIQQRYFNSGVMFVKDHPVSYEFYDKWYFYWNDARQRGCNVDQPSLAKANKDYGFIIKELDGRWNCQMVENFVNYLSEGKILHYFASFHESPYLLYDDELMLNIQRQGFLDDTIKNKLKNPKELFREKHMLVYDDDVEIYRTSVRTMFRYHRWFFNIFEYISWVLINRRLF